MVRGMVRGRVRVRGARISIRFGGISSPDQIRSDQIRGDIIIPEILICVFFCVDP